MGPDDLLDLLVLRRGEVDDREERWRQARLQLQDAGKSAYEALRAASYSSEMVARSVGTNAATIRKLNTDGDRAGWEPRSRKVCASLDLFTEQRLGRSWDLARHRDHLDEAGRALKAARKLLDEVTARAEGLPPTFGLGVLYLPGLRERCVGRSLRQLGDALGGSFAKDEELPGRGTTVEVVEAQLAAGDGGPARLVLQPRRPGRGATETYRAGTRRWMVAVSPVEHGLADDQELRGFLRWLLAALPWFAADAFDQRLAQARCLPGARLWRCWRSTVNAVIGVVGIPLLALALALVWLCLVALLLPGVQRMARGPARLLARGFGATFASTRDVVTLDAQVNRAARDLDWLRRSCRKVVVVAHGQASRSPRR